MIVLWAKSAVTSVVLPVHRTTNVRLVTGVYQVSVVRLVKKTAIVRANTDVSAPPVNRVSPVRKTATAPKVRYAKVRSVSHQAIRNVLKMEIAAPVKNA